MRPGRAATRWRASRLGPGGRGHVTAETAAASWGTCPGEPCGVLYIGPTDSLAACGAGPRLKPYFTFLTGSYPS